MIPPEIDVDGNPIVEGVKDFKKICETWIFTPAISVKRSRKVEATTPCIPNGQGA